MNKHGKLSSFFTARKQFSNPGLNTLLNDLNRTVSAATISHLTQSFLGHPEELDNKSEDLESLSFLHALLTDTTAALASADFNYISPWVQFFGGTHFSDDGFLVSEDNRLVFLFIEPRLQGEGVNARQESISTIRRQIAALLPAYPSVQAGVTGEKALDNDEMVAAEADSRLATILALLGVGLLYFLFFRSVGWTLLAVATTAVGLSWSLGVIALTVGHVSLISIFIAPILVGLANDRIVYFLSRYEEERAYGRSFREAIEATFTATVSSMFIAGATNASAFYAMMGADFRGVQELGFITGSGILISCVATATFLPAMLTVIERARGEQYRRQHDGRLAHGFTSWEITIHKHRQVVLTTVLGTCVVCLLTLPSVAFDYDLLHLQARNAESVAWEKRILSHAGCSSWFALTTAHSLPDAAQKAAQFESLPMVEKVESIAALVPPDQDARLQEIQALAPLFAGLPPTLPAPVPVNVEKLKQTIEHLRFKLQSEPEKNDAPTQQEENEVALVRVALADVLSHLQALPSAQAGIRLDYFQEQLFRDLNDTWTLLQDNLSPPGPITLADLPTQLKERFVSTDDSLFLLRIYPRADIWEWASLREFLAELRQADADVTGSPVIGYESICAITKGYSVAGLYAVLIIMVVSFVIMRHVRLTLFALLLIVCGSLLTLGIMWLGGLRFNLANLVALPITLGIGSESGFYFVRRVREEHRGRWQPIAGSTERAIALFSLSTMVGFGSLMVARYYGIFSMGLLLPIAVGCVCFVSLTVLPLCFSSGALQSDKAQDLRREHAPAAISSQTITKNDKERSPRG